MKRLLIAGVAALLLGAATAPAALASCAAAGQPPGCADYAAGSSSTFLHLANADAATWNYLGPNGVHPFSDAAARIGVPSYAVVAYSLADGAYQTRLSNTRYVTRIGVAYPPGRVTCYYAADVSGPDTAPGFVAYPQRFGGCVGY